MTETVLQYVRFVAFIILSALIVIVLAKEVEAHSFYDAWCCNENDCAPYHGEVRTTPQGFYLPEFNITVPYKEARYNVPSWDEFQYHLCEYPKGTVRCFYAKPGGV